jgi:hypothetical protein
LGKATKVLSIQIEWPVPASADGAKRLQRIDGPIALNRTLRIEEGVSPELNSAQ